MKKFLSLILTLLLIFSLAGCNDAAANENIKMKDAENRLQGQQSIIYVDSARYLLDACCSYNGNDCGIFFFSPDGKYVEWTDAYLCADIPFVVDNTVLKVSG